MKRQFLLILSLLFTINPAINAMRTQRAVFAKARSLNQSLLKKIKNTPLQLSGYSHRDRADDSSYSTNENIFLPSTIGAGVLISLQEELEEEKRAQNINNLDINNMQAILEVFKNGTQEHQELVAKKISQRITYFSIENIIILLQNTTSSAHSHLTQALCNNITYYTNNQIIEILIQDTQENTHAMIAQGIGANLNMFIKGPSWYNVYCAQRENSVLEFHKIIEKLNSRYHETIMRSIADNLLSYSFSDLSCLVQTFSENSKIILHDSISREWPQILVKIDATFSRSGEAYRLTDLHKVCNEQQKAEITALIEQKLQLEDLPDCMLLPPPFLGMFYDICGVKSKAMIVDREISNLERNAERGFLVPYFDWFNMPLCKNLKDAINTKLMEHLKKYIDFKPNASVSDKHLQEHLLSSIINIRKVAERPLLLAALNQALEYERKINNSAHVFYHSQQNNLYWLELLYTKLWECKHKKTSNNYLFTRFYDDHSEFSNAVLQDSSSAISKHILQHGRPDTSNWQHRPYVMFTNGPLFGNSTNWGSNSIFYTLNNFNIGIPNIANETVFNKFGLSDSFANFSIELANINKEFLDIVQNNVLLQIIIPENITNETVYLAKPYGLQTAIKVNGQETKDVNALLKAAKSDDKLPYSCAKDTFDTIQYCIPMTPDIVHKLQDNGAEIKTYGDFDQEKLSKVIAKLEALIERISQENLATFSSRMTPAQSYKAFKPVVDDLLSQHKD